MSHLIFLDEDEDTCTEEMSLNNRAGMLLQLLQSATCVTVQRGEEEEEVCELCVLYVPHDLMLMKRLDGSGIVHCDN